MDGQNTTRELVSVITPNFNGIDFLEMTIRCVLNQSYHNWEMVIVDDCSTDGSYEMALQFAEKDNRIRVYKMNANSGHPSIARNLGIEKANGEYVAFLDNDDLWPREKLSVQINEMKLKGYKFTYSSYILIDEKGKEKDVYVNPPLSLTYSDLLKCCSIGCLTAVYDVNYFGKLYFEPYAVQEDYLYWLALLKKTSRAHRVNCTCYYRVRPFSVSSNKVKMAKGTWKIYRQYEKLGLFKSSYYFLSFVFNWIKRRV